MIYLILYVFLGIHSVNFPVQRGEDYIMTVSKKNAVGVRPVIASETQWSVAICDGDNLSYRDGFVPRHDDPVQWEANNLSSASDRNEVFVQSDPLFEGIHKVHVSLEPKSIPAKMMAMFVKPQGEAYIKLTPAEDGAIWIQFCDAEGNVRMSPSNGTGFYAGAMPKRLYLTDVKFRYKDGKIIDAQNGKNKVKVLPCADCSGKNKQWTEEQVRDKTKSSDRAVILPKAYSGIFEMEIELNLSVAFNAVIKEIKQ